MIPPCPELPPEAIARLRAAEARQRAETIRRDLPAAYIDVCALWALQRGLCGCGCGEPLDPLAVWSDPARVPPGLIVIAHRLSRGSKGGHVPGNVWLDRWACNHRDAAPDASGAAKMKRFAVDRTKRAAKRWAPKPKPKPSRWPKGRKLQSRPIRKRKR
jgi:hypothetical protein